MLIQIKMTKSHPEARLQALLSTLDKCSSRSRRGGGEDNRLRTQRGGGRGDGDAQSQRSTVHQLLSDCHGALCRARDAPHHERTKTSAQPIRLHSRRQNTTSRHRVTNRHRRIRITGRQQHRSSHRNEQKSKKERSKKR